MRNSTRFGQARQLLSLLVIGAGLTACGGSMDDLNEYIDEVKARPGQRPEPLPEVKPYETFVYRADANDARSPFQAAQQQAAAGGTSGPRPEDNRPQEYLEQFPLDSLAMVGTLELNGQTYGLLQDTDNIVHRVVPGNYVGQNDGRIQSVSQAEIAVMEIVSDGLGGYLEREASISLAD